MVLERLIVNWDASLERFSCIGEFPFGLERFAVNGEFVLVRFPVTVEFKLIRSSV